MPYFQQFIDLSIQSMGIIPILTVLLFVVLAVAIERSIFFSFNLPSGEKLDGELCAVDHRREDAVREIADSYGSTIFGATLQAAVESRTLETPEAMDRYIDESIVRTLPLLDKYLWLLGSAVTLGPLIGLLGTIIGITESFNVLGTAGPSGSAVTSGIGHALIATGCGLLVAIAGVAANSYFAKRVRLTILQLDLIKLLCVKRWHLYDYRGAEIHLHFVHGQHSSLMRVPETGVAGAGA
ncbi:MotA/TolQ/ExbB proton channel family protein [Collimonas sp.]|jgi:biopolymer transport protein ExbB|uniref:MotA/TolQ/ExbB proton channel family protein n=1 Tax=Collimonas sp. TaxID=1963772 RepID=UPI002C208605|nr:MotA/TolQ/ExbB proton channel family protein [Collimonas sp.]HWW07316.1 MotA/TolQ/ExbB proton channel family protein [Collimonas sp.]